VITTLLAVALSGYRYYDDHREIWRYERLIDQTFARYSSIYDGTPEDYDIFHAFAQNEAGRRALDRLRMEFHPFLMRTLRAVNARGEAIRVHFYVEFGGGYHVAVICVVTDDSGQVLTWRELEIYGRCWICDDLDDSSLPHYNTPSLAWDGDVLVLKTMLQFAFPNQLIFRTYVVSAEEIRLINEDREDLGPPRPPGRGERAGEQPNAEPRMESGSAAAGLTKRP
jgi:hypothetical protein